MIENELVEKVARQVETCRDTYEAPSGKIMARIWINDLAELVKLARAATEAAAPVTELREALKGALKMLEGDGLTYPRKWDALALPSPPQESRK